jgi:hypothetical protein
MPGACDLGVLKGEDDIAWGELGYAYGAADDVPGLLGFGGGLSSAGSG